MIRRKGIPEGGCSMCCRLKMKLEELWQRTSGCILKIRGVTPDGDGNFELEAGQNVNISEVSNGLRISTTGGVSYYTSDDPQLDIDNDDLKISLVDVAKDSDLDVVAQSVANIVNGTTQVEDAAHADTADSATSAASATNATNSVNAQYLGSSTNNVGSDTKAVKIVNGEAVPVTDPFMKAVRTTQSVTVNGCSITIEKYGNIVNISSQNADPLTTGDFNITSGITYTPGLVPIIGGDGAIKGYLYGDGYGNVFARFSQSGNIDIGFRATYFTN